MSDIQPANLPCRVCGTREFSPLWSVRGFDWQKCKTCGSLQTTRIYAPDELKKYYADNYYEGAGRRTDQGAYVDYIGQRDFIQGNLRQRVDWSLHQITSVDGGDWLDIGCAAGFLLDIVRDRGYRPWGIDYSDYGPHYARSALGLSGARQATIEALPDDFPDQFDIISAIDVVEHVTNQRALLTRCAHLLRPGGYLICETFDPRSFVARLTGPAWHAIDPPNHFAILSLAGIRSILQGEGLESLASVRLPRRLSIPAIATKFGRLGRYLAHRVYKSRLSSIGISIALNDVVLWIYRKSTN